MKLHLDWVIKLKNHNNSWDTILKHYDEMNTMKKYKHLTSASFVCTNNAQLMQISTKSPAILPNENLNYIEVSDSD